MGTRRIMIGLIPAFLAISLTGCGSYHLNKGDTEVNITSTREIKELHTLWITKEGELLWMNLGSASGASNAMNTALGTAIGAALGNSFLEVPEDDSALE